MVVEQCDSIFFDKNLTKMGGGRQNVDLNMVVGDEFSLLTSGEYTTML